MGTYNSNSQTDFLESLQQQARHQSLLDDDRLLPAQLDGLARIVVRYPWQTLLIISLISTIFLEFVFAHNFLLVTDLF